MNKPRDERDVPVSGEVRRSAEGPDGFDMVLEKLPADEIRFIKGGFAAIGAAVVLVLISAGVHLHSEADRNEARRKAKDAAYLAGEVGHDAKNCVCNALGDPNVFEVLEGTECVEAKDVGLNTDAALNTNDVFTVTDRTESVKARE